ncbi:putative GAF sensor protein [Mycolicibacterium vanbaalenii PYR-1]|uniref:GAF sensor protein n=2 Tax=Mycolicibacterium TaxID=1866885 RepID=A1TDD3_MYCVP|nr:helix-turn-helix domain-containing protein [Mycolicibacterium vanbaalenii]ABM15183.1 putative GAF sensor protein [Mycolicibacterium vanbaalenii PYR-1]
MSEPRSVIAAQTALIAALRDVVSARSVADVESATLAAVRSLLSADAAFWMDRVDDGFAMTALSGLIQPESHELSLVPPGAGLAAEIVANDAPASSSDYTVDPRAIPAFAAMFRRENIRSTAGAPMRSSEGVVGVLFVFARRSREFTEDEMQLLMSIAGVARALRERLREGEFQRELLEQERSRAAAGDRLLRAAETFSSSMLRGQPLAAGLEAASDELGVRLHVRGLPAPGSPTSHMLPIEDAPTVSSGPEARIPGADLAVLSADGALPEMQLALLAQLIGIDFRRQRVELETELALTDQMVHSLLTGDFQELERLWSRTALLGMNPAVPRVLVSIGRDRPVDRMLLDRIRREMRSRISGGYSTTYGGDVVLLCPVPEVEQEAKLVGQVESIVTACRPERLTAGIGPVCRKADDYPLGVREALFARQVAAQSRTGKAVVSSAELGMYRLFAHVGGTDALLGAVLETLGPLLDADGRDGSDLLNTLHAFLEHDRRIAETARALHLHVNTLRYRVDRIARLLKTDLDDPEKRFFILLALRLRGVVGLGPNDSRQAPSSAGENVQ